MLSFWHKKTRSETVNMCAGLNVWIGMGLGLVRDTFGSRASANGRGAGDVVDADG